MTTTTVPTTTTTTTAPPRPATTVKWKLVTTYNEWGEGTTVAPAKEWASPSGFGVYLDILHNHLGSR